MKKLIIVILMLGFAAGASAQAFTKSATANVSAHIYAPVVITKNVDLAFGNIEAQSTAATVILVPGSGVPTRTPSQANMLPTVTGTPTAAQFTITGEASVVYTVTLPGSATTIANGSNNMTVDTWTVNPSSGWNTGVGGSQVIYVGATINVGASQVAGTYTQTAPFTVSVEYN